MRFTITSLLVLILGLAYASPMAAGPRDKQQMVNAAATAINKTRGNRHMAPRNEPIEVLKEMPQLSVIGYKSGGFAIVSADDLVPEILGVSYTEYTGEQNQNFAWWLHAMCDAVEYATTNNVQRAPIAPDTSRFPDEVEPMMTTLWDQDTPYNNFCPTFSGSTKCLTGCVATAMAQVLNYHKIPDHGIGKHTIYYGSQPVTADFENTYYDWGNMLDEYKYGRYNDEEASAVATLMMNCGVAADMEYGGPSEGSGAYSDVAANGLRQYFGLSDVVFYDRTSYNDDDWMDIVFMELSENGPVYYGGADMTMGGHAFVLHGYDSTGMVYVNWGWSGDDDGYYDISLLNPSYYKFRYYQDMIGGISSQKKDLLAKELEVEKAGQLTSLLPDSLIGNLGSLSVIGPINGQDLKRIREMAGRDIYNEKTKGCLNSLDLSRTSIVGGGTYMVENGQNLVTKDDELPRRAFYGCNRLSSLQLPSNIKSYGDGALALCYRLKEVTFIPAEDANFDIKNNVLWNKEGTEVIAVLPTATGEIILPHGTRTLHDYAMAGCNKITKVIIPDGIELIGKEAFNGCNSLSELRIGSRYVPELGGANVFVGMNNGHNDIYVRSGMKNKFLAAAQWKDFTQEHIKEFGTSVKVRNTIRYYGDENPELRYTISGDKIEGEPELHCDATPTSPVGRYPITISAGTITDDAVDFYDGYLVVQRAPLTVTAVDCERYLNAENPTFALSFEGFKNNETDTVFVVKPTATTTATIDSPAGTYPITVTGGETNNYELSYVEGTLTVLNETGIMEIVNADDKKVVYNLNGSRINAAQMGKGVYIINGKKYVVK